MSDQPPLDTPLATDLHPKLTQQEKAFVFNFVRTRSIPAAAEVAGIDKTTAQEWLTLPHIQKTCDFYDSATMSDIKVTRSSLTNMLFEAHRHSATATEEINAIREIGKMNGIYEPEKTVTISANYTKIEQMESLSDEELLALGDESMRTLIP